MMPEKLDLERIRHALVNECGVYLFESINSTNEWALERSRDSERMPFACFAEQQTNGRGRRGKAWVSPAECNIYMSLAWLFEIPVSQIGILSLATGLAVVKALEKIGIKQAMLKWPNDVLVDDKKIAGILIEVAKINENQSSVVIGIGLNYLFSELLSETPGQPWTDIVSTLKAEPEGGRNTLAGLLLQECISMCQRIPQDREVLIDEFQQQYDTCAQQEVSVLLDSGEQLQGVACGVTSSGEIRILIEGEVRVFNSAEISLRKLNQKNNSQRSVHADD